VSSALNEVGCARTAGTPANVMTDDEVETNQNACIKISAGVDEGLFFAWDADFPTTLNLLDGSPPEVSAPDLSGVW
jgi:hypothetical protein